MGRRDGTEGRNEGIVEECEILLNEYPYLIEHILDKATAFSSSLLNHTTVEVSVKDGLTIFAVTNEQVM